MSEPISDHEDGHDPLAGPDTAQPRQSLRERRQQSVRLNSIDDEPQSDSPGGESLGLPGRSSENRTALTDNDPRLGASPPLTDSSGARDPAKHTTTSTRALKKLAGALSALSGRLRLSEAEHDLEDGTTSWGREVSGEVSEQEWERELKLSLREAEVGDVCRVCVGSPKGGIGKSSLAYAFAGAVARYTNLRVALVDVDPNFGSLRTLVPRPTQTCVLDLAIEANEIRGLSQMRNYVSKNDKMGLDVVLGPSEEYELAAVDDLGAVYKAADGVLSEFYDVVVYDMGVGFRDPAIREVLAFSDEFVLAVDAEQVTNTMVSRAIKYLETLDVGLSRHTTTLVINHLRPPAEESASASSIREAHTSLLNHRRVTEIPYDAQMSQLLNDRSFDIEDQFRSTRLRVLLTAGAVLGSLQQNRAKGLQTEALAEGGGGYDARSNQ